ncbi:hypothetical protein DFH07DRAFT_481806 [Mycena maculata]|uniref:Uncharacterized protein n=1 Tax=Mycena maculata TaxID=230809 RepID=A0AAD7NEK7_9AGAR|nr:hypothetical protein DFH07DRAFT_481806 [Mycena maculata]
MMFIMESEFCPRRFFESHSWQTCTVYTIVCLVRKRSAFKGLRLTSRAFPLSLFIRTASYSSIGAVAMIFVYIINSSSSLPGLQFVFKDLAAAIPLSVALVFGTQHDILSVYMFWKKKRYQDQSQNGKV